MMYKYIRVLGNISIPNNDLRNSPGRQVWNPLAVRTRMLVIWGDRPAVLNLAFPALPFFNGTQPKFLFKRTKEIVHITFVTHHSSLMP